jgi:hypothetical protein
MKTFAFLIHLLVYFGLLAAVQVPGQTISEPDLPYPFSELFFPVQDHEQSEALHLLFQPTAAESDVIAFFYI